MNVFDIMLVTFSVVFSILIIDVIIIWNGGFPFPMKQKKKFMQINDYILNPDNISFIRYDNNNDVARIYFANHNDFIEVDINNPYEKSDFIQSLNECEDFQAK